MGRITHAHQLTQERRARLSQNFTKYQISAKNLLGLSRIQLGHEDTGEFFRISSKLNGTISGNGNKHDNIR
jgi:hypothetical protein